MRVAILGLGLIGGSIARSLRTDARSGAWSIAAWSPSGDGPARALRERVVDAVGSTVSETVAGADLVVLAGPPSACLAMLDGLAADPVAPLDPSTVVTDVASTKALITRRANDLGARFVGGHPMAGTDRSGYDASTADLFVDRPWVVVPTDDDEAVTRVEDLARACGARPVRMIADDHDRAVAAISHLPLVVAAALVESVAGGTSGDRPDWPLAASLAASGWRDATRLARGDVAMGTGIAMTNPDAIADRIRELMVVLDGWLAALDRPAGPDEAEIVARLTAARDHLATSGR